MRRKSAERRHGGYTVCFYGYDGAGNVRQLTNSAGAVTDSYDYDAFGNLINSTGTTPNNYLYRGEQYDPDLNIYYLRARYYNPATGRFLSRDPEDGKPIDPKSLHKYLFADGDPTNKQDPTGRVSAEYIDLSAGPFQAAKVVSAATLGCQVLTLYNFIYTTVSFFVPGGSPGFGDPGVPWWVKYGCAGLSSRGLFR